MHIGVFIKVLWPIWIAELLLNGIYHFLVPLEASALSLTFYVLSSIVLPFVAGLLVVRAGGSIGFAVLGGISVSAATILAVAAHYFITTAGLTAFIGFIVATLVFSVGLQAIFGTVGGFTGKRIYERAI